MGVADLGCSSGPNSLTVVSQIIYMVNNVSNQIGRHVVELSIFLNDLPGNDFNYVFQSLPKLYQKLKYDFGIEGLEPSIGNHLNKEKIYISKNSPASVVEAYQQQFHEDFSLFLRSRAEEMVSKGRMVLSFMGRRSSDPRADETCDISELLAHALLSLALDGHLEKERIDSFNIPFYTPSLEEVQHQVKKEGSFVVECVDTVEMEWDVGDLGGLKESSGTRLAKTFRAVLEPMLGIHFHLEAEMMDELFRRYAKLIDASCSKKQDWTGQDGTRLDSTGQDKRVGQDWTGRDRTGQNKCNYYISGVPGSFYGRLFPSHTLHFIHSSSSLHWLSQVPSGLEPSVRTHLNKEKVYISTSSPASVVEAYQQQFHEDFSLFLRSRAKEMVAKGRMVLSFVDRQSLDPCADDACFKWELLARALMSLALDAQSIDSFNIPIYAPSLEELQHEVEKIGSFAVECVESVEIEWDVGDSSGLNESSGTRFAKTMRAGFEPFPGTHFHLDAKTMDELFRRYAKIVDGCYSNNYIFIMLIFLVEKS
ncbi:hypothetical protein OSB04_005196 [Centaurea solstitialis]|uniref:Jasmonate O-methyltransferase n=1 Tax=Centaurea solstitialis TaxID=347529 RepID=A0AA38TR45_9ASTR|nr:hypothetical protein OSB04_005196 [Centaurea solstitialis]